MPLHRDEERFIKAIGFTIPDKCVYFMMFYEVAIYLVGAAFVATGSLYRFYPMFLATLILYAVGTLPKQFQIMRIAGSLGLTGRYKHFGPFQHTFFLHVASQLTAKERTKNRVLALLFTAAPTLLALAAIICGVIKLFDLTFGIEFRQYLYYRIFD